MELNIDPRQIADHQLMEAQRAVIDWQPEVSETRALLSIAASLREIAALMQAPPPPSEHELRGALGLNPLGGAALDAPDCCGRHAVAADDLLEMGYGLVCNADNSISSGLVLAEEWRVSARRFIAGYNELVATRHGGSLQQQMIRARAQLDDMIARDEVTRLATADALADELAERSAD